MKLSKRQALTGWALVTPLLLGCVVFYLIPFSLVIWFSGVSGSGANLKSSGAENYAELMENEIFRMALGNTALSAGWQ